MATFTDNLDGTAGALLSARSGWSRPVGADNLPIAAGGSGVQITDGATLALTFHAPDNQPSGNDQYAEAILGVSSNGFGLCVRVDTTGGVVGTGYIARRDTAARLRVLYRNEAGGLTLLAASTAFTSTNADANPFRLEAVGEQITVYFMGSVLIGPITNAGAASGKVGIFTRGGTLTTTTAVDNWGSGDVGATAQTLTPSLFTNAQTFHAPTVALGSAAQTLTPSLVVNAQTFHGATVSLAGGAQTLLPPAFSNAQTFHAATVATAQTLIASHFINAQTYFGGTVYTPPPPSNDLTVTGGNWAGALSVAGGARGGALTVTGGNWN